MNGYSRLQELQEKGNMQKARSTHGKGKRDTGTGQLMAVGSQYGRGPQAQMQKHYPHDFQRGISGMEATVQQNQLQLGFGRVYPKTKTTKHFERHCDEINPLVHDQQLHRVDDYVRTDSMVSSSYYGKDSVHHHVAMD